MTCINTASSSTKTYARRAGAAHIAVVVINSSIVRYRDRLYHSLAGVESGLSPTV
jgi:hypothetical protein